MTTCSVTAIEFYLFGDKIQLMPNSVTKTVAKATVLALEFSIEKSNSENIY